VAVGLGGLGSQPAWARQLEPLELIPAGRAGVGSEQKASATAGLLEQAPSSDAKTRSSLVDAAASLGNGDRRAQLGVRDELGVSILAQPMPLGRRLNRALNDKAR
jgi:hypothetical protein